MKWSIWKNRKMKYELHLKKVPFDEIDNGVKTIELRFII